MNKQFIIEITILLALIPALVGYYANYKERWVISLLAYLFSFFILLTPPLLFATFKCIQHFSPLISRILSNLSLCLKPILEAISANRILGPCLNLIVRCYFFVFFIGLLMCDQLIRKVFGPFIPQHATQSYLSVINVGDSKFFRTGHQHSSQPHYSLSLAHTLCVASKLAYEDVKVVQYELEQAGYTMDSFKPIGYKNVCAYVVESETDIILVFRGTNPLNIQNYVTNLDAGLTEIGVGKVHKGFWDAMGETVAVEEPGRLRVEIAHNSIISAIKAIVHIVRLVSFNIFQNITDPIDTSWVSTSEIRYHSLYSQAESYIIKKPKKKLFITGHSLGGALATVFLAKMIQSSSPLLEYFEGLYTFGQPNMGDEAFGKSFPSDITCKIFNHTYNNDAVPRIPFWYSAPPGNLVFIDASYKITLYPPDPHTNQPVPVRAISYLHPSGLLNLSVIRRLKQETSVRIFFRILFPFFINDHFPSDYSDALLSGHLVNK